jgi:hypothetical protein
VPRLLHQCKIHRVVDRELHRVAIRQRHHIDASLRLPRTPKPRTPAPVQPAAPAIPQLDIEIALDALTIGDLRLFSALKNGTAGELDLVDLLDRCVVGGVAHLPLTAMPQIAQALSKALDASSNPKN